MRFLIQSYTPNKLSHSGRIFVYVGNWVVCLLEMKESSPMPYLIGIDTHGLKSMKGSGWLREQVGLHHHQLLLHHMLLLHEEGHHVWRLVGGSDQLNWVSVTWMTGDRSWHPNTGASSWLRSRTKTRRTKAQFNWWLSRTGWRRSKWWGWGNMPCHLIRVGRGGHELGAAHKTSVCGV